MIAACASQRQAPLDEKYFEREANNYLKFQQADGQTVYCQNVSHTASLIPYKFCITEASLRQRVENARRDRNAVTRNGPQYVATVPGG
jgi:hypothetical protein